MENLNTEIINFETDSEGRTLKCILQIENFSTNKYLRTNKPQKQKNLLQRTTKIYGKRK